MAKVYGIDYWAEKIERRNKRTLRDKEDLIIKTMTKNIINLKEGIFYRANKEKQKQMKAIAHTVPLTGWIK